MVKNNYKKIGILGGSFDPPHKGHLFITRKTLQIFNIDHVIWAITKKNPFKKKPFFSLKLRKKLCQKLLKREKKIEIKYYENKLKSNSTYALVKYLKKSYGCEVFFIIGADNLINLHRWKYSKELIKITKFIVFSRKGYDTKAKKSVIMRHLTKKNIKFLRNLRFNTSSTKLRNKFIDGNEKN